MKKKLTNKERKALQDYFEECLRIKSNQPGPDPLEPAGEREARKARLLEDFTAFCKYYFPHYMKAEFGWFHLEAKDQILSKVKGLWVLEWPRAHAKSVFCNVLLPLYLKAKGEMNGMIVTSQNYVKAVGLLIDIQSELKANQRYIADFGEQYSFGDWAEGQFTTRDGIGFWAFGRGQSPRGTRVAEKRPDYITVDDIDDEEIIENQDRTKKAVKWVKEALFGCFDLTRGRMVVAGNRIDQRSILAHIVGDVEDDDVVNPAVTQIKVYALENPHTHEEERGPSAQPAWKEFYSRAQLEETFQIVGYIATEREYFHRHIKPGNLFQSDWFVYAELPPPSTSLYICTYCDPSWKGTKTADYKAIVAMAKNGRFFDVYGVWVRKTSVSKMVQAHYDLYEMMEELGAPVPFQNWMEAGFLQDLMLEEYTVESETRGHVMPIRGDEDRKGDKVGRIEATASYFERKQVRFAQHLKGDPDMATLKQQYINFPSGHDDGPDAMEGAFTKINKHARLKALLAVETYGERRENVVI